MPPHRCIRKARYSLPPRESDSADAIHGLNEARRDSGPVPRYFATTLFCRRLSPALTILPPPRGRIVKAREKRPQNNVVAKYRGTGQESRLASFKPCIASAESDSRGGSEYLALRMQRWGGIIAVVPEQQHAEFESSSVAQGAYDLGLWDCRSISYRSTDHCTVAGVSFGSCSRVTVSLRHHVHCVVWWSGAGIARDGPLRARFQLLFPAPDALVSSKDRRDTTHSHFYGVSPHCRVAERCAKERYRIAEAGAR